MELLNAAGVVVGEPLKLTTTRDEEFDMCTEACGQVEAPDAQELLEAFEIVAHDALAFLAPEHDLHPQPAATFNLGEDDPVPVSPSMAQYPFKAVLDYDGPEHPVRLRYGDREYELAIEIALNGSGFQPLQAWLDSLDIAHELGGDAWISTPSSLARHTRRLARTLRDNFDKIIAAGPGALREGAGEPSAAEVSRDRDKARSAFADGDYAAVVAILEQLSEHLTATEQHQLEFARKKL